MTIPQLDSKTLARTSREHALHMVHAANASHIGSCFSLADILAVLYAGVLRYDPQAPRWPERDRVIVSKGHAAAIYYATLAECGFFPREWLATYCKDGGKLAGHVSHYEVPGVEISTGSLGHGLSVGCGMALAAARSTPHFRTFVLLSDGECDEGSIWEAALFAGHHRLEHLVAVIDANKWQSFGSVREVLELEPFADKWRAFGWGVDEVDGHDHTALQQRLSVPIMPGHPSLVIARTIKGKGVDFMEDTLAWHYKSPDAAQLEAALQQVRGPR